MRCYAEFFLFPTACLGAYRVTRFLLLPSKALDYGLFDSTSDELLAAMGWASLNITWAWFLPLLVFLLPNSTACKTRAKLELVGLGVLFAFIFLSAIVLKISLGYAVLPLIIAIMGLATPNLATLKVMQGDRFIIGSLLSIILLIFFLLCIRPSPFLCRCSTTARNLCQAKC
ncbi:hypothetical protein INT82_07260 [Mannheimia haemolytica]|nr:hypothetical protein [Mannheimia haemolytica]